MKQETTFDRLIAQFASTFREWHYFIGGASFGVLIGLYVGLTFILAYKRIVEDSGESN